MRYTTANVRSTFAVWHILWSSTCSAAAAACPWRGVGRTALFTCSCAANKRLRVAPSGRPIFFARCRLFPFHWHARPGHHFGPAAPRRCGLCSFALRSRSRLSPANKPVALHRRRRVAQGAVGGTAKSAVIAPASDLALIRRHTAFTMHSTWRTSLLHDGRCGTNWRAQSASSSPSRGRGTPS